MRDAADLSRQLAARIRPLVAELLPHGRREGHEWRCGSLAGEKGQSLAVHLSGTRAGVWCDFAGGERGDALDLVASVLFAGRKADAMAWARRWLGISAEGDAPQTERRALPPAADPAAVDTQAEERRGAARRIWTACPAGVRDTPVAAYLSGRGINLAELHRAPGSLRHHHWLWNAEAKRHWPAMVAAISGAAGQLLAVHRTWLTQDAASGKWDKAPVRNVKMTLGGYVGGTIRLQRGASGKPLAQAPDGERVALAEGIETALSVALACPELRVLAAVSLANMCRVELPPAVRHVIVAADDDTGNPVAHRALKVAVERFQHQGRTVAIAKPDTPGADWNDILRAEAVA